MPKAKSVFLDTNIWIYAYSDTEKEKRDIVLKLLNEDRICLSSQVVNEFIWVMSRKYRVDFDILGKIVEGLFDLYPIDLPDRNTIVKATGIAKKFSFSYTHGTQEGVMKMLFDDGGWQRFFDGIEKYGNDNKVKIHFVSAREMVDKIETVCGIA